MLALAALTSLLPALASAATCVQFDSDKNLYAFGGEQDVAFGTADTWGCESLAGCSCGCCGVARGMELLAGRDEAAARPRPARPARRQGAGCHSNPSQAQIAFAFCPLKADISGPGSSVD